MQQSLPWNISPPTVKEWWDSVFFFFKKKKLIRLQRGLVTEGNEEERIIQGGKEKEKYKIK